MVTQEMMNALVPRQLRQVEEEHRVKVLFAVESGSRAWGFASPDSDFDVRFIYVRPKNDYLCLQRRRDVIELPIDDVWDVNGWDLAKALVLLRKSNPTLFEWLNSPIVYWDEGFRQRLRPVAQRCFSEKRALYHYYNMARGNHRAHLTDETVVPKKYFYVLRPALACLWVMTRDCPPPVSFDHLAEAVLPAPLRSAVDALLDLKINGPEKQEIEHMDVIDAFLEETLGDAERHIQTLPRANAPSWDLLNTFFLDELGRV